MTRKVEADGDDADGKFVVCNSSLHQLGHHILPPTPLKNPPIPHLPSSEGTCQDTTLRQKFSIQYFSITEAAYFSIHFSFCYP